MVTENMLSMTNMKGINKNKYEQYSVCFICILIYNSIIIGVHHIFQYTYVLNIVCVVSKLHGDQIVLSSITVRGMLSKCLLV